MYHINSPTMDGSWAIFKDVSFDPFKNPRGCSDTIQGICYKNLSLSDCMNSCKKDSRCNAGYFLQDDDTTYCLDLVTGSSPDVNPSIDMRNKDDFPDTKDLSTYTFINTKVFPYPPDDANIVRYNDIITLHNIETNFNLSTTDSSKGYIVFEKNSQTKLKLLSQYPHQLIHNIRYGELIGMALPETNLLLRQSEYITHLFAWISIVSWRVFEEDSLILIKANENETLPTNPYDGKVGNYIQYGDKFHIMYNRTAFLGLDGENKLGIFSVSKDDMISKQVPFTFQFIPKDNGYYCNVGKCNSISLDKTVPNGEGRRYKNQTIYRSPICFGVCPNTYQSFFFTNIVKQHPIEITMIVISLILIIVGIAKEMTHIIILGIVVFFIYIMLKIFSV